jgi:hypothetical protein
MSLSSIVDKISIISTLLFYIWKTIVRTNYDKKRTLGEASYPLARLYNQFGSIPQNLVNCSWVVVR